MHRYHQKIGARWCISYTRSERFLTSRKCLANSWSIFRFWAVVLRCIEFCHQTRNALIILRICDCAQLVTTGQNPARPKYGSEGYRFNSCWVHQFLDRIEPFAIRFRNHSRTGPRQSFASLTNSGDRSGSVLAATLSMVASPTSQAWSSQRRASSSRPN